MNVKKASTLKKVVQQKQNTLQAQNFFKKFHEMKRREG